MNPKVSYMLVGFFVLFMGTALVTAAIWLSQAVEDKKYRTYATFYSESVSGLHENASVTYLGVDVGKVRDIGLDPNDPGRVRVLLDITEDTHISEDTIAILRSQGITGLAHVELTGGTRDSRPLTVSPDLDYPEIPTGPSLLVRLDQAVTTIIDQLTDTAKHVDQVATRIEVLLDDENQAAIAATLVNVEDITGSFAERAQDLETVMAEVNRILANTASASEDFPELIEQGRRVLTTADEALLGVNQAAAGIDTAAETFDRTALTAEEVMVGARRDLAAFTHNTPAQIELLVNELQQVSESFRRLSLDLERDPNMLLFGRPEPEPGPGE